MTEHLSSRDLEREIETERTELAATLSELGSRFSIDSLVREVASQVREHGGDFGKSAGQSIKENPLGLALTGIGLSWLIFGRREVSAAPFSARPELVNQDSYVKLADRVSARGRKDPDWSRPDARGGDGDGDTSSIGARLSGAAGRAQEAVSGTAREGSDRLGHLRERLGAGTEHLSADARDRVIAARQRALAAREQVTRTASRGGTYLADFYERQPLVFGAIALAIGAAVAGSLPRSKMEDAYLGEHSDWLMEEAERIYAEESERTKESLEAVSDDVVNGGERKAEPIETSPPRPVGGVQGFSGEATDAGLQVAPGAGDEVGPEDQEKPRGAA